MAIAGFDMAVRGPSLGNQNSSSSNSSDFFPQSQPPPLSPPTKTTSITNTTTTPSINTSSSWARKYRGATVEDLDPPPALSCHPSDRISTALLNAYERDYTHLTVVSHDTRALLGYLNIPRLKSLLSAGTVQEEDPVDRAMQRFRRRRKDGIIYRVITMETPLEELEAFFNGDIPGGGGGGDGDEEREGEGKKQRQDFAVVTDGMRRFVLGVVTRADLEEFVKRRPE